jgi:hypothetical protein
MKVYEELGLTKDQYLYRIRKGLLPRKNKRKDIRYSGLVYENSAEKIETMKEKYKNGVTKEILAEWLGGAR